MRMTSTRNLPLLACAVCLVLTLSASALMIAPAPVPLRIAAADAVVVGKVTGFADKTVKADMFKGDERQMQIAKVKVEDTILGRKAKEIQVGFFPPMAVNPGQPVRPILPRRGGVQLSVGQEGMLLLTKHPSRKDVYVVQNFGDIVTKTGNPNFAKELAEARKYAKILSSPMAALKSKDDNERFVAAAVLVTRYRTQKPGMTKTEAVPAEESKLILQTLARADWSGRGSKYGFMMNPQGVFARLGLTAKDGWTQPRDFAKYQADAKKWLEDNAGKYKIQRYVSDKKEEPDTEPR